MERENDGIDRRVAADAATIDAVVVSYNSRDQLRASLGAFTDLPSVNAILVDNDSADGSADIVADLPVTVVRRRTNGGFALACNEGMSVGSARYVLFVNPDAVVSEQAVTTLAAALDSDPRLGAVAPRIEHPDGSLAYSLRRYPRLLSTFAQALYLHRLFPRARWTTEIVKDRHRYEVAHTPEWVSGACLLARRSAMESVGGWDERFFLYCEDTDLCLRLRRGGFPVGFEPRALVVHEEGMSSNPAVTLALLADAKRLYAETHEPPVRAIGYRAGLILWEAIRVVFTRGGRADRIGHRRALALLLRPRATGPGLPESLR